MDLTTGLYGRETCVEAEIYVGIDESGKVSNSNPGMTSAPKNGVPVQLPPQKLKPERSSGRVLAIE